MVRKSPSSQFFEIVRVQTRYQVETNSRSHVEGPESEYSLRKIVWRKYIYFCPYKYGEGYREGGEGRGRVPKNRR